MGRCEWDRDANEPALVGEKGCANEAVYRVGDYHLCEACADLPRFKRYKKNPLKRPQGRSEPGKAIGDEG